MFKRNLAIATFMTVPIVAVAVANPTVGFAENQEWISEESGIITNPAYEGEPIKWLDAKSTLTLENKELFATTLSELTSIIENEVSQFSTNMTIHYTGDTSMNENQISTIIDNYLLKDDYAKGTVAGWRYDYQGNNNGMTINITISYHTTKEQEKYLQSEVKRIVQEHIQPTMSEMEKVKAINDYIVLNTTYSEDSATSPHAAYTILYEGKGVCQAYALLAYQLLREAGIEVRYVTGWAKISHAWNLVKVDGQWYHLDTTWNDPVFSASKGDMSDYVRYKYFLISDREIEQDHRIDDLDYPKATSDRFGAMRGIESPVQIGKVLYYPNENDDIKLYKLDLSKHNLQAEKISDIRVQYLLYANNGLYFSNFSNSAYLYKMNLDGSNSEMLVKEKVTKIQREGTELVAFNENKEIYRELIQEQPELQKVNQLIDQVSNIVFISKHFKNQAEQLLATYGSLSSAEQLLVPVETHKKIAIIQEKYNKMQTLTFGDTVAWASVKSVTHAERKIKLSQEVLDTPENLKQIEVVDMFGDTVNAFIRVDGDTITIIPVEKYIEDVPYTLIIKSGLKSVDNQTLQQGVHLQFIMEVF